MRYNTVNKRRAIASKITNYLTDYGYDDATATYEVRNYVTQGLNFLTPTPRKHVMSALIFISKQGKNKI